MNKTMLFFVRSFVRSFVLFLAAAFGCSAQSPLGTILGTVRDSTGALVPDATVVIKNNDRGNQRSMRTDAQGDYRFELIPEGNYELAVEQRGFKKYQQTAIVLLPRQTLRLDAALQVGELTEAVTVTGEVPVVNSETVTIAESVDSKKLDKYPVPLPMVWAYMSLFTTNSLHAVDTAGQTAKIGGARKSQTRFTSDGQAVDSALSVPPGWPSVK